MQKKILNSVYLPSNGCHQSGANAPINPRTMLIPFGMIPAKDFRPFCLFSVKPLADSVNLASAMSENPLLEGSIAE